MISLNGKFGLVGYPLGHSYSKEHFTRKFEQEGLLQCSYNNFEIESASLIRYIFATHEDLIGLNVTIPHKQAVIPFLDFIDPVAREIGAVNTIKVNRSGSTMTLTGYNTDVIGFSKSMEKWPLNNSLKALVFGTGGSSLAVKYVLMQLGIEYETVSRQKRIDSLTYEEISPSIVSNHLLWINCTPVGMFPKIGALLPLPYELLTTGHFLFDLVYNPDLTGFLKMGGLAGASIMNGRQMLYEQAEAAWKIWTE
jgi:shikimate dehydrogenase